MVVVGANLSSRTNYRYIEPMDPEAEKACRLTAETAAQRDEPAEEFFAAADDQEVLPNGYELRFLSTPQTGGRIDAFIAEEQQCCPFFAFETWQEAGQHVLRILRVDADADTPETLPQALSKDARWRTGFKPGDGDQD